MLGQDDFLYFKMAYYERNAKKPLINFEKTANACIGLAKGGIM